MLDSGADDESLVPSVSPTVGNCQDMIPNATQASLDKYSLSVLSVKYTICRVVISLPDGDTPVILKGRAPIILIPVLFAAVIDMLTRYRLDL